MLLQYWSSGAIADTEEKSRTDVLFEGQPGPTGRSQVARPRAAYFPAGLSETFAIKDESD